MPEKWTKRSRPPSSGVMNPNPLSSENHLTVPVPTDLTPFAAVATSPVRPSMPRVPRPAVDSGPVGETLSGGLRRTQAKLTCAGCIRREVHASGGPRTPVPAPYGLAREAQLGRPPDQRRVEAEMDRAGARPGDHGVAERARQPV